jgi:hypothetical protein
MYAKPTSLSEDGVWAIREDNHSCDAVLEGNIPELALSHLQDYECLLRPYRIPT